MRRSIKFLLIICSFLCLGLEVVFGQDIPTATVTPTAEPTPQPPMVTTGDATDIAGSATLNGIVNANGLLTTAWFEYGTTSSKYSYTTSTQTVSGSNNTTVNINTGSLPIRTGSPYTFYYRIVAQNNAGTSYGNEKSFTDTLHGDCLVCYVSGKVTDAITKNGIESADVNGKLTDADGSYLWEGEASGFSCSGTSYIVTASANGYRSQSQSITFGETSCFGTLNFELQPITCEAEKIKIFPKRLKLAREQSGDVTVIVKGDNCMVEGETVEAIVGKASNKRISISSTSEVTNENGEARFTITAKNKIGKAKITFKVGNLKKSVIAKVR